ncbi:MAG: arginine--tRNA ligase [Thermoguttaceae bacterium]
MSILPELERRFRGALAPLEEDPDPLLAMIRRSQDPKFGDYQANFAMALGKKLGRDPRQLAAEVAGRLSVEGFCEPPEVAGPGFINLRVRDDWIVGQLTAAIGDERLGVPAAAEPRTYVVDFSAPNVAKPMHVGHIRSTSIGDALARTLRFAGHRVVTDNHIGDWGTQFGMIIYGYRNFCDREAYGQDPVRELSRLYQLVRRLIDYHEGKTRLAPLVEKLAGLENRLAEMHAEAAAEGKTGDKKVKKAIHRQQKDIGETRDELDALRAKLEAVEQDPGLSKLAAEHPRIGQSVLEETARLHAGDEENRRLWREFLPPCLAALGATYKRLGVAFDHTLGESFYHQRLEPIVEELIAAGIARESDGAVGIFFEGQDAPMLIRKKDGAFLYATTDLATLRYRVEAWQPDAILYVVDFRQSLHFENLFATARRMGYERLELKHVSFGTVLGEDGRPFKTREGDAVGLESLLDEAVARARKVVEENDDAKPGGAELSPSQRARIAETVGIAALKYADLSQNRDSDYVFSYDKMLAMNGNTATYMQYAYARVRSIFAKGGVDAEALRAARPPIFLNTPAERDLALELLRFGEAVDYCLKDYRPNQLTSYLFELANCYSTFFENCPVLKAETPELRQSRLVLCDLTARTIQKGLGLLGIDVVEKM